MNNLLSLSFWFDQRPGMLIPFWRNTLIVSIVTFLVLALVSFILKKKGGLYSKLYEKIFNLSSANIFIGLLLLFFNNENIPLLSSRFWYMFWAIGLIVWTTFIVRYAMTLPIKKKEIEKQREFEKYLPK